MSAPSDPLDARVGRSGLIGAGLVIAGCATSAALFDRGGSHYSILACFISELGDLQHARGHAAFNGALMLAAAPLLHFMLALGQRFRGGLTRLAQLSGVTAAVGAFFVGVFPVNQLARHMAAANTFFYGGMLAVLLYSLVVFLQQGVLPRWVSLFGALVGATFAAFLFLPLHYYSGPRPTLFEAGVPYQHPDFWLVAFVEWLVLLMVLGWVLTVSVLLVRAPSPARGSGGRLRG